jgi:hypothetical protein
MVKIVDGILGINKDAKVNITGKDIDTCTIEFIEGTVEISKADIKAKMAELETKETNDAAQLETDKANANKKLKDLGLTDDEIKAIKGIE